MLRSAGAQMDQLKWGDTKITRQITKKTYMKSYDILASLLEKTKTPRFWECVILISYLYPILDTFFCLTSRC